MEPAHTIYLAAGCFWGAEKYLKLIRGVLATRVGFVNGDKSIKNPSYKLVYTAAPGTEQESTGAVPRMRQSSGKNLPSQP